MWHHAPYFLPQSECSVLTHRVNWKCLSELWRCALTVRCWTRTVCTLALFFSKAFLFYLIFFAVSRPSAVSLSSALVLLPFVLWDGNLSMLNPSHAAVRFQVGRFWTISPSPVMPWGLCGRDEQRALCAWRWCLEHHVWSRENRMSLQYNVGHVSPGGSLVYRQFSSITAQS